MAMNIMIHVNEKDIFKMKWDKHKHLQIPHIPAFMNQTDFINTQSQNIKNHRINIGNVCTSTNYDMGISHTLYFNVSGD